MAETTRPGKDGSDGVGRGAASLLPLTVVSGHSSVSSLSLHDVVAVDTHGGHKSERSEALSDNIRLNITIVVLASPNEAAASLDNLGDNIVDESVLVPEVLGLHLLEVLLAVDSLEGVHEETIVLLKDSVLGGHLEGEVPVKSVAEASTSKSLNRLRCVKHAKVNTGIDVGDVLLDGLSSVLRGEGDID